MPFKYPDAAHQRKHGPEGYERYQTYKDWLRDEFTFQCVYCLERERWYPNGHAGFGVDHVLPKGDENYTHLTCHYPNLVYACNRCNTAKSDKILIDPCLEPFSTHLRVDEEGEIEGLTVEGRRIVNTLGLDLIGPTEQRKEKIIIFRLYAQFPDNEQVRTLFRNAFGFPEDLPDLAEHSRTKNTKPEGVKQSYFRQRESKTLPETYGI
jgi:hypothetical protein